MANIANKSTSLFDDEFFDDSALLANFENSDFKDVSQAALDLDKTIDRSFLNVSALCCDEEISGYDKLTGKVWVYPTNYPVRDYQFNIIKAAILKNTLVSLPTGLGKTFIAAVIMYNFYRWYPLGKIVFTAPTRPLVAQQIEACYKIVALPPKDTIEMTGHMPVNTRKIHWQTKRVFFATPQVIYNDIKSGICPGQKIRCLVIDEAHRARGNYAYCQIISTLSEMGHTTYRVLALSATPGSKVEDVINVVKSLHIAHLELRAENCIDVASYSHSRKINTVIIELGPELTHLRKQYIEIMDRYARRLQQFNILPQNLGNLSKGRVLMLYKEYQTKDRTARHPQHNYIMKDFTFIISLYHGLELLVKHGSRVFLNFFDEHPEKSWIQSDDNLTALLERLRDDLGIDPLSLDRSILPDGTIPEMPKELVFGHPKFYKLKEIMLEHFNNAKQKGQDTKAIVFCEYRESVNLVHCLLLQCRPLIVPQMFVGQGASGKNGKTVVSQKQQLRVMRSFRSGDCNTLVCTCVAEEGLDVGAVDLILCFDISTRSPVRLVQRCGRTGRERGGHVYILVTEGREHQTLLDCMRQRDGLNKKILQSKEVENNLYKSNPRMIPRDFMPECQKMYITVPETDKKEETEENTVKSKKGQKDLRNMLLGTASTSTAITTNKDVRGTELLTKAEFDEIYPKGYRESKFFADPVEYWSMSKAMLRNKHEKEDALLKITPWLELQRTLQKTINIGHSVDTKILTELLQYNDAHKPNKLSLCSQNSVPNIESAASNTQDLFKQISSPIKAKQLKKKQKAALTKSPGKNGDIRAIFSTATKSTKNYTKLINDLDVDGNIPTRIINLLVDLSLEKSRVKKKCYFCENVCNCSIFQNRKLRKIPYVTIPFDKSYWPDIDLIDNLNAEVLMQYNQNISENELPVDNNKTVLEDEIKTEIVSNFDLQFDFDSSCENDLDEKKEISTINDVGNNFDIGNLDDIFSDSTSLVKEENDPNKTLEYFGLGSFEDIFADSDDEGLEKNNVNNKNIVSFTVSKQTEKPKHSPLRLKRKRSVEAMETNTQSLLNIRPPSPSILSGNIKQNIDLPTSPILSSQGRKFNCTKINDIHSSTPLNTVKKKLNLQTRKVSNVSEMSKSTVQNDAEKSNKSMLTITQLINVINKTDEESSLLKSVSCNETSIKNATENASFERESSPILLTQRDRQKSMQSYDLQEQRKTNSTPNTQTSIIIPDSDDEFEDSTEIADRDKLSKEQNNNTQRTPNKRKLIEETDDITSSPYFVKKQKLDQNQSKPVTIQEKVLAALNSTKMKSFDNNTQANFVIYSPTFKPQKENKDCLSYISPEKETYGEKLRTNLAKLQIFRRESKLSPKKAVINDITNIPGLDSMSSRNLRSDDSDDDFVDDKESHKKYKNNTNDVRRNLKAKHKVKKRRNKANEFLDLEAELSDDDKSESGDELSDESVGSIIDFICDNNVSHDSEEDMQAVYLRSVKSPVKGVFKIPQLLPHRKDNIEVLSQYVEEDSYELDSFCVDSHIGLTQVNEVSELDLAEMLLEEKRRNKKSSKSAPNLPKENGDSPIVRKKQKNIKRIQSDSDDSN